MPVGAGGGALTFGIKMPAQHEEEIGVIAQFVVDHAAIRSEGIAGGEHGVGDHDGATVAVGFQQCVCPVQDRQPLIGVIAEVVFEMDDDEVHTSRVEELVAVGVVVVVCAAVIVAPRKTRSREVDIEPGRIGRHAVMVEVGVAG